MNDLRKLKREHSALRYRWDLAENIGKDLGINGEPLENKDSFIQVLNQDKL